MVLKKLDRWHPKHVPFPCISDDRISSKCPKGIIAMSLPKWASKATTHICPWAGKPWWLVNACDNCARARCGGMSSPTPTALSRLYQTLVPKRQQRYWNARTSLDIHHCCWWTPWDFYVKLLVNLASAAVCPFSQATSWLISHHQAEVISTEPASNTQQWAYIATNLTKPSGSPYGKATQNSIPNMIPGQNWNSRRSPKGSYLKIPPVVTGESRWWWWTNLKKKVTSSSCKVSLIPTQEQRCYPSAPDSNQFGEHHLWHGARWSSQWFGGNYLERCSPKNDFQGGL